MSNQIVVAIVSGVATGVASGIASGVLASRIYVRRTQIANATGDGAQAVTGRVQSLAQSSGGSQAVSVRRGVVNLAAAPEHPARLTAAVQRSDEPGLPRQVLVLRNTGERPAENLVVDVAPEGGRFLVQPDWRGFPLSLAAGQQTSAPCVTTGVGHVSLVVQYVDQGSPIGPILLEAMHE